jgi:hypothetical protein
MLGDDDAVSILLRTRSQRRRSQAFAQFNFIFRFPMNIRATDAASNTR